MAVLSDADRAAGWATLMRDLSGDRDLCGFLKSDGRAAFDAADAWAEANAAAFNSALPLPFRTSATARQKARLLNAVVRRRWELS